MPSIAFYIFTALAAGGALALIMFRNPVSSALSMVVSFIGMAALFIGLNAYFVGIIQILVYAGAIMVLFLFIIMLLDLKVQERSKARIPMVVAGCIIPAIFMVQLVGVLQGSTNEESEPLALKEAAVHFDARPTIKDNLSRESLPDVHLVGETLFTQYNFPLQVIGVLLLVSTVGVVALSRKGPARKPTAPDKP
jgi:NADH-quinone oxidoreductase subunit J